MLKREDRALFGALLLVAAALVLCWAVPSPYSKEENDGQKCSTNECREIIATEAVAEYTRGLFLVTAFLAAASAWQGYFLIRADKTARISAETAKSSAEAAVAAEMPMVFLQELVFLTPQPPLGPIPRQNIEGVPPLRSAVVLWFKNYGRTPARVTEVVAQHLITKVLPPEPRYGSGGAAVRTGIILEPGKEPMDFDGPSTFAITEKQQTAIANDEAYFWVYGFIGYRDFLGKHHEARFCYSWFVVDPGDTADTQRRFIEGGPESYRSST